MTMRTAVLGSALALTVALAAACSTSRSNPAAPAAPQQAAEAPATAGGPATAGRPAGAAAVPPYFASAEAAKPFPPLMPASFFRSSPVIARAYRTASRYPGLVAQQPCYCHCDRLGHRSLLDCYAVEHAAG
jgi:Protein of unknown function with PCYCGC motif